MSELLSLEAFAAVLTGLILGVDEANRHSLEKSAKIVEKEAKDAIGTYKFGWPQLAPSTQKQREHEGFAPNEPLLRTGELRDSIEHKADHKEAHIGSDLDIAIYQELGTSKIPPRSFLQESLRRKTQEVLDVIGRGVVGALEGNMVAGPNSILPK